MENETEIIDIKPKNMYIQICIAQSVCIIVLLIGLLVMKFFFEDGYKKAENWCQNNLFEQTKITANFDEDNSSED